jgi:sugar/nucleoside kinase (ribokinase family)
MLSRPYDILCAGELLVNLISEEFEDSLEKTETFKCVPGGSPANLCMNMARLGGKVLLAASVGNDDLGTFLKGYVTELRVEGSLIRQVDCPTTLILVTRSGEVSNFEVYRSADARVGADQLADELLKSSRLFHTTCFALSREPAKHNILEAAKKAHRYNCQLSIDLNYAEKVWPDREEARQIVREYCSMGALVKASEVDWIRLYEEPSSKPEEAAAHFLELGAGQVCITLGSEGCYVAGARDSAHLTGRRIDVKDTTGAGDAFWAGYLTAWLDGYPPRVCGQAGMRMAELKLGYFGPLPPMVDKGLIFEAVD